MTPLGCSSEAGTNRYPPGAESVVTGGIDASIAVIALRVTLPRFIPITETWSPPGAGKDE